MMMGSSSAVGGSSSRRMHKLTALILSILFVMMILWSNGNGGSNDNDIDSTATTMPRQLSSLQQFMDPKSTNLRSEIVGGVIPHASVYIDQDGVCLNALPYAKMHNKDPKEVESYQSYLIQGAGGDALEYGEIRRLIKKATYD